MVEIKEKKQRSRRNDPKVNMSRRKMVKDSLNEYYDRLGKDYDQPPSNVEELPMFQIIHHYCEVGRHAEDAKREECKKLIKKYDALAERIVDKFDYMLNELKLNIDSHPQLEIKQRHVNDSTENNFLSVTFIQDKNVCEFNSKIIVSTYESEITYFLPETDSYEILENRICLKFKEKYGYVMARRKNNMISLDLSFFKEKFAIDYECKVKVCMTITLK